MENKKVIINLLESTERDGVGDLIDYLKEEKFFTKPASINYHSNYEGGLAEHSLLVYKNLSLLNKMYELNINQDSLIIIGLLHDLCKLDKYTKEIQENNKPSDSQISFLKSLIKKSNKVLPFNLNDINKEQASSLISWLKENPDDPMPEIKEEWSYADEDKYPLSHAEKSIFVIQKFIDLKEEEWMGIRYHMGAWEKGLEWSKYSVANSRYPEVKLTSIADEMATFEESWTELEGDLMTDLDVLDNLDGDSETYKEIKKELDNNEFDLEEVSKEDIEDVPF